MDDGRDNDISNLRRQAEFLDGKEPFHKLIRSLTPTETEAMLHELHVHEIELEIQNEELRRTQAELEISRSKYFDLYDLAPVGYCTVNELGLIVQTNLTATSLFGISRSALVMRPFRSFIEKADQDIHYLHHNWLLKTGKPQRYDLRLLRPDRSHVWVRIDSVIVNTVDNAVPVVNMALSDITESKILEKAVQESEERYKTLVEGSPEPVIVKRRETILYVNPSAIRLLGAANAAELEGMQFLDLVHVDYRQTVVNGESEFFLANNAAEMVHEVLIKRDGTPIDVESKSMLITYDGKPAIHSSMRDITERMRLNTALIEKNIELEKAKSIADKANNAKTDFISGMSHDLRTPLNAILGFAQLIDTGPQPLTPSQKRSIDQILKAGWYLLDLINEILDLSLIESGKQTLSLVPVPLLEVIRECGCMVEQQAEKHGIKLTIVPPDSSYQVMADPMRFRQIINNLLSNAIKYNTPRGSVIIEWAPSARDSVRISVRDTGEGLSPDQISELYQPFHRLGRKNAKVEQGTGIGLVVCKRLVESMGGVIGVESAVGTGSVFWFELKRSDATQTEIEGLDNPSLVQTTKKNGDPLHSVLYIEDKPGNVLSMCGIIALRSDIRLLSARNGESGLEVALAYLPELILTDIDLPGISGSDVLRLLSENPKTAHIPVIALGEPATPEEIESMKAKGFLRYLSQPIAVTEFFETLDKVFISTSGASSRENDEEFI